MKNIAPRTEISWDISIESEKTLPIQIERILSFLNRNCKGSFYITDYHTKKLYSGATAIFPLTGHPKNLVDVTELGFMLHALKPKEKKWLEKMNEEMHRIFYKHSIPDRLNLEISFELIIETVNQKETILRHRLIPFELDRNGNLWMSLVFVTEASFLSLPGKATITNSATSKKYTYNGKAFIESKEKILTDTEIEILRCLAKGIVDKQILNLLKLSSISLARKKHSAFAKLGAKTAAEATYLARNREII